MAEEPKVPLDEGAEDPAIPMAAYLLEFQAAFWAESPDVGAFLWALARENEGSFVGMSKP